MVLRPDVLAAALDAASPPGDDRPRLLMSARGFPLRQHRVRELVAGPGLVVLCGRFEGVDERIIAARGLEEICIGYFVLLIGRQCQYFGRRGETHVELFPSNSK
jgi:tRNA (guanine37-N1)-methyltransferase